MPPPPKGKALEVGPAAANAPSGNAGFSEGVASGSFGVADAAGLKPEDEDTGPAKLEKSEDEVVGAGLGSEEADAADGKLKGDGSVAGAAELGVVPKPAKLCGGTGIVAGAEVAGLGNENGVVGMEGLFGGLGAPCVFA